MATNALNIASADRYAQSDREDAATDSGYAGSEASTLNNEVVLGGVGQERQHWATTNVQQLYYNQNRVSLGRSITRTIEVLKDFQRMNTKWPAHYPSDDDYNVLKLDLKLGALAQTEQLVQSLEKASVASLLDGKISASIKHLSALRERIDDTSSKVLVTGDLNAGKSTFCNAVLRKKVLPEDQQPCTSLFCEVLDARENCGVEEVHALHKDIAYNRGDEATFDIYTLEQLEDLVIENDKYQQVKIYIEDVRSVDQSLLRNGVVDISLIDAPGLNLDSIQTTAVFARQEEIDVVVFVVSAENHFTLSAKEFIWNAANEKAYIFIVVNRFDNIRDKKRCKRLVLEQIAQLSPRTYADADELVHFVSSNSVLEGTNKEQLAAFDHLETSLRSFVLEKRARSKLAPAKHYLLNLLKDVQSLGDINNIVTGAEIDKIKAQLEELTPAFEAAVKARAQVCEELEKTTEETCTAVYKDTRRSLNKTIEHMDDAPMVPYDGLLTAYSYAELTRQALFDHIHKEVLNCEERARGAAVKGVSVINGLGILHLSNDYVEKAFRPELMFTRKRDALARTIDTRIDILDFFDWEYQEKVAGVGMSLTLGATLAGQLLGFSSWLDAAWKTTKFLGPRTTKKLIFPVLVLVAGVACVFVAGDIHKAVPRKLAKKMRKQLAEMDYVHGNADRISREVRKVLSYPSDALKTSFARSVEKKGQETVDLKATLKESEVARKWFGNLVREVDGLKRSIDGIDLEAIKC